MVTIRRKLGDYLPEVDPVALLWIDMVDIVFHDSPVQARVERLGAAARLLFQVGRFEAELINGGMRHFFSAPAADFVQEVLDGLRQIGASITVGLLQQALQVFPGGAVSANRRQRCDVLFALCEPEQRALNDLSDAFFRRVDNACGPSEEDLTTLQVAFMQAHCSERLLA